MPINLQNDKIILRALEPEDLSFLYACENNTDAWRVSYSLVPMSRFVLKQYLENSHQDIFTAKQLRLIIVDIKMPQKAIGAIDLFDFDPFNLRAGLGIIINDDADKGKGFAKSAIQLLLDYAFNHLLLNQVYCHIDKANETSIALFEKCGFVKTGVQKQWRRNKEDFSDVLFYQCFNNI